MPTPASPGWLRRLLGSVLGRPTTPAIPPAMPPAPRPIPPGPPATARPAVPTRPTPTPPPDTLTPAPAALAAAINRARLAHGRPALDRDAGLEAIAAGWAAGMARGGVLAHGDFAARLATVHPGAAGGENVASGFPDASSVVGGWLNDRAHRDILLGDWDLVGAAWAVGPTGVAYAVADFAIV